MRLRTNTQTSTFFLIITLLLLTFGSIKVSDGNNYFETQSQIYYISANPTWFESPHSLVTDQPEPDAIGSWDDLYIVEDNAIASEYTRPRTVTAVSTSVLNVYYGHPAAPDNGIIEVYLGHYDGGYHDLDQLASFYVADDFAPEGAISKSGLNSVIPAGDQLLLHYSADACADTSYGSNFIGGGNRVDVDTFIEIIVTWEIEVSPPDKPSNLQASLGDQEVALSWSAPTDGGSEIIEYKIYRGNTSDTLIYLDSTNTTTYNDSTVVNFQNYKYAVSAVNNAGEGAQSTIVAITPLGDFSLKGLFFQQTSDYRIKVEGQICTSGQFSLLQSNYSLGSDWVHTDILGSSTTTYATWELKNFSFYLPSVSMYFAVADVVTFNILVENNQGDHYLTDNFVVTIVDTEKAPPEVSNVLITPNTPTSNDSIVVSAFITDSSGLYTSPYSTSHPWLIFHVVGSSETYGIKMNQIGQTSEYQADLGVFQDNSVVKFSITAEDKYQNVIETREYIFQVKDHRVEDVWVLLIGIEDYSSFPSATNLDYCIDDVSIFSELFNTGYNVPNSQIHRLLDSNATITNFDDQIEWLGSNADSNDAIIIYFSGHGGQVNDTNGDEVDGKDEFIALYDTLLIDDALKARFNQILSGQFMIFMDSCNSGGFLEEIAGTNRLVISSCDEDEFSYENSQLGHGVFSYFLQLSLRDISNDLNNNGIVSFYEAYFSARPIIAAWSGGVQNPQCIDQTTDGVDLELKIELVSDVGSIEGGTSSEVLLGDSITVTISANEDGIVTYTQWPMDWIETHYPSNYQPLDAVYEFQSTTTFSTAEVKIEYDTELLAATNIDENTLAVFYYNPTSDDWEILETVTLHPDEDYLTYTITHFSVYAIFGEEISDQTYTSTTIISNSTEKDTTTKIEPTQEGSSINASYIAIISAIGVLILLKKKISRKL